MTYDHTMNTVITYRLAYVDGEVSLCASCEDREDIVQRFGVLGAVQHGRHDGTCDACGSLIGRRVAGGSTPDDYDEGRIVDVDGDCVEVAWDTCVRTWQPFDMLHVI